MLIGQELTDRPYEYLSSSNWMKIRSFVAFIKCSWTKLHNGTEQSSAVLLVMVLYNITATFGGATRIYYDYSIKYQLDANKWCAPKSVLLNHAKTLKARTLLHEIAWTCSRQIARSRPTAVVKRFVYSK